MDTLIFDLDDTLLVDEASAEAAFLVACDLAHERNGVDPKELYASIRQCCRALWYKSPARAYCLQIGISSWEGLWAEFCGDDENLNILREWAPKYRRNSWIEALRRCRVDDSSIAAELSATYVRERRKRHVVYEDVVPTLRRLKQSYKLGLLTNGAPDLQRRKIEASGLEIFFTAITISGEEGFGKPDRRIFELMLERLGADSENTAMVGNSLKSDILPAQSVGMKGVWINRDGRLCDTDISPDTMIHSLSELVGIFD